MSAAAETRCRRYRKRILEISQQVTALHIAPAFSCLEIVDVIYHDLLNTDEFRGDEFIMSKGHGVVAQYVVLEDLGILPTGALAGYCKPEALLPLGAHPDRGTPGIVASTGSLGHGLSMAVGMALAEKLRGSDACIYCLLSDGEMQEGSTWEAMMMAMNLKLDNLVAFVDNNDFGGLSRLSADNPAVYPLVAKAASFGWGSLEVYGHNRESILFPLSTARMQDRPTMIVCQTIKGKGVSFMEEIPMWHYRSPDRQEYAAAMLELDR